MQVVDAVQEVPVVSARDAEDLVVAVVTAEVDEALSEVVHGVVDGHVIEDLAAGLGESHHDLVLVRLVGGEDEVADVGHLEDVQPRVVAVAVLHEVLDALQQDPVHPAATVYGPLEVLLALKTNKQTNNETNKQTNNEVLDALQQDPVHPHK